MLVSGLVGVTAIAAGYAHSLALKNDGTVWAWGQNYYGQLGNGTTMDSTTPVPVSGLSGVTAISGGDYHSLALRSNGTVWAWGANYAGQLGNGTMTEVGMSVPAPVSGLVGVTTIAAGYGHSLALKNDGTVWAWGQNDNGQLGNGTVQNSSYPAQVSYLGAATAISAGGGFSLAAAGSRAAAVPPAVSFGDQIVDTASMAQNISLTNTGGAPLTVSSVSVTGANAADFVKTYDGCSGMIVYAGGGCSVSVQFAPTTAGPRSATLAFTDDAPGSPHTVALSGNGTPTPANTAPAPPTSTPPPPGAMVEPTWTNWRSLGGILSDSPGAVGFNNRVYVFAKGSDGGLYVESSSDGVTFTDWQNLGGQLTAAPAAAAVNGTLYVFAKGSDDALYVRTSADGVNYTGWRSLGGKLTAPPAAGYNGQVYVFAKGTNTGTASNPIYPMWVTSSADGFSFAPWQNLGGNLTAAAAAAAFDGRLYIFVRGTDVGLPGSPVYPLWGRSMGPDGAFSDWLYLGGNMTSAPSAATYLPSGGSPVLYIVTRGSDGAVYERHTPNGANYTSWVNLGGQAVGPPAAAEANGRLFVFLRGADNALWERHTQP